MASAQSPSLLVLESQSRGLGLAIKRARVVFWGKGWRGGNTSPACPGGATEKRLHLWCGCVKHECMCVRRTFMAHTLRVNSV